MNTQDQHKGATGKGRSRPHPSTQRDVLSLLCIPKEDLSPAARAQNILHVPPHVLASGDSTDTLDTTATRSQLESLVPGRDRAVIRMESSKADQCGLNFWRLPVKSSQVKLPITNNAFAFCKEQQHSQKQEFFVILV
jgi:hypothetical protein